MNTSVVGRGQPEGITLLKCFAMLEYIFKEVNRPQQAAHPQNWQQILFEFVGLAYYYYLYIKYSMYYCCMTDSDPLTL